MEKSRLTRRVVIYHNPNPFSLIPQFPGNHQFNDDFSNLTLDRKDNKTRGQTSSDEIYILNIGSKISVLLLAYG
jgi:hypothetical protein